MLRIQLMMSEVLAPVLALFELSYRKITQCGIMHAAYDVFSQEWACSRGNAIYHGRHHYEHQFHSGLVSHHMSGDTCSDAAFHTLIWSTNGALYMEQIDEDR